MKKRVIILSAICLCLCVSVITTYSWFVNTGRTVYTQALNVETPPVLYVRNHSATPDAVVLDLNGIVLGQRYTIVFCVMPIFDSITAFDLQLAYTQNMNQTINLYSVSELRSTQPDDTVDYEKKKAVLWDGSPDVYFVYDKNSPLTLTEQTPGSSYSGVYRRCENQSFLPVSNITDDAGFAGTISSLTNNKDIRYFVLEITWGEGEGEGLSDPSVTVDAKETDLLYVYVKNRE